MKRDMQFLLRQLHVIEHMQDREGIALVAKRNGIVENRDIHSEPVTLAEWEAYKRARRGRQ